MTDFSPLDSALYDALYESTPEKIAASLRYLRKADAVMAALMPLSANTQTPPAAARDTVDAIAAALDEWLGPLNEADTARACEAICKALVLIVGPHIPSSVEVGP